MKQKLKKISKLKKIFSFIFDAYICFSAFIGLLVFLYLFLGLLTNILFFPVIKAGVPINLGNGFICADHPSKYMETRLLTDRQGNVLVQGSIDNYKVSGDTVYGGRMLFGIKNKSRSPYRKVEGRNAFYTSDVYFICTLGQDCNNTQNYNIDEFLKILDEKGLEPIYLGNISNTTLIISWIKNSLGLGVPKDYKVNVETIEKRY